MRGCTSDTRALRTGIRRDTQVMMQMVRQILYEQSNFWLFICEN
jgi:hypothetical protein